MRSLLSDGASARGNGANPGSDALWFFGLHRNGFGARPPATVRWRRAVAGTSSVGRVVPRFHRDRIRCTVVGVVDGCRVCKDVQQNS